MKTRIQKMEKGPDGKYPYKGSLDCAMQTFTKEGPLKFYTGFPTYCIRCGPCTACAFMKVTETLHGVRQQCLTNREAVTTRAVVLLLLLVHRGWVQSCASLTICEPLGIHAMPCTLNRGGALSAALEVPTCQPCGAGLRLT